MLSEAEKIQKRKEKFAGTYDTDIVKTGDSEKDKKLARQKRFEGDEPLKALKGFKSNRKSNNNLGDVSKQN